MPLHVRSSARSNPSNAPELLLTGTFGRPIQQRLKRGLGAPIGIRRSQEAMRRVMAQINAA
jgi:hypothetical protein